MSIYAWIVAFVLTFAAGAATGLKFEKGQQAIRDNERMEQARADHSRQEKSIDAAAASHEKDKKQLATEYVVITERIEDAKQTDFYAAGAPACLDDRGVRIVNDAIRPAAAASQPARAVPGPADAAGRRAGDGS